ncbi:MAG: hypothetical protein Q7S40_26830 [Opitutaceae bacterium]|nr:hypothetical protein [Opitutaceae bacterium]
MSRPSLFHWVYRWFLGGVITLALFATALAVVNVIDGLPFWLALRRVMNLRDYNRWQNRIPLPWWRLWPRLDLAER